MRSGSCGFVLSQYNNIKYVNIDPGMHFGIIDIISCLIEKDMKIDEIIEDWIARKDILKRQFTVRTDEETQLMTLSIKSLNSMKFEFQETY